MRSPLLRAPWPLLAAIALGSFTSAGSAQDLAGMVKTLKGQASIERAGRTLPVHVGDPVMEGDQVSTSAGSAVGITLRDDTQLAAGEKATLLIKRFAFNPTTHAGRLESTVRRGSLAVISGKIAHANPDAVQFNTSTMTLGVRGTEFIIDAGDQP